MSASQAAFVRSFKVFESMEYERWLATPTDRTFREWQDEQLRTDVASFLRGYDDEIVVPGRYVTLPLDMAGR